MPRRQPRFRGPGLLLFGIGLLVLAETDAQAQPGSRRPRRAPAAGRARNRDEPPPCPVPITPRRAPPRPAPRTMPDLFMRMAESFSRNPAGGFQEFVQELGSLEGPALQGITVSPAEERQTGKLTRDQFLKEAETRGYRVVRDEARLRYLNELVTGLAQHMTHRDRYPRLEVTLVDNPIADGVSFPGGYLVFTTGLLNEPDEATVAGVVAHELAHLDRGHMVELARRDKLAETTFSHPPGFGASFDQFFTRQMALLGLLMNPFRPEQEHDADCTATTWLYLDGYDPKALMAFFERMHRRQQDQPDQAVFAFARSHPFTLDRREHVARRTGQLQAWKPRPDLGLHAESLKQLRSQYHQEAPRQEP